MAITHLKIEQASTGENVSAALIEKLAEVAHGNLDAESNLSGVLNANKAYRDSCEFLVNKFSPNLGINVPQGNHYIRFADPEVARLIIANYGDGFGITENAAKVPTNFNGIFKNNTVIRSFDEYKLFTNITEVYHTGRYYEQGGEFYGCSNLETIDLTNIDWINGQFEGCVNLKTVKNFSGRIISKMYGDSREFINCVSLESINLSNVIIFGLNAFSCCTSLHNIGNLSSCVCAFQLAFADCPALAIDVNCPHLSDPNYLTYDPVLRTNDRDWFFVGGAPWLFHYSGILSISNLGKTTKLRDGTDYYNYDIIHKRNVGFASQCPNLRFVILPDTLTYIGTYAFWGDTALEYVKVLATTPPTLGENDPTNNAHPFYNCTCKFYVPNGTLSAYQAASGWDALCQAGRVFEMSQFATDFPND